MFLVVNFDLAKDHVSEVLARGGDRGPAWTGFDAEKDFPGQGFETFQLEDTLIDQVHLRVPASVSEANQPHHGLCYPY